MGTKRAERPELNFVHQNAILCETIRKEQRNQKLYTNYSINPFKKSKFPLAVNRTFANCDRDLSFDFFLYLM